MHWTTKSGKTAYDKNEIRVELVLDDMNDKSYYEKREINKETIESEFGQIFVWHNPENTKQCRVYIHRTTNIREKGDWNNQHEWLLQNLEKMKEVFSPYIQRLVVE